MYRASLVRKTSWWSEDIKYEVNVKKEYGKFTWIHEYTGLPEIQEIK